MENAPAAVEAWTWATWVPIFIAAISAIIAIAAAVIAYVAPRSAAHLAEELRVRNADQEKRQQQRWFIFASLMQERVVPFTLEAVRAFNVIDVVYQDNRPIREAWAQYYLSLDEKNQVPLHTRKQYFNQMLRLLADDLGLHDIRTDDLERVYYPGYLARRINIETMQQQLQEQDLQRMFDAASTNTTPQAVPPGYR